jgi:hypothetical protein
MLRSDESNEGGEVELRVRITRRRAVFGAVLVALASGAVAYAAIPDSNGVYTACKLNATGTIRLIDPAIGGGSLLGRCSSLETRITWNEKGDQGVPGPKGDQGIPGAKGDPGDPAVLPAGTLTGFEIVNATTTSSGTTGAIVSATAQCPADKQVIGGGYRIVGGNTTEVENNAAFNFWRTQVRKDNDFETTLFVRAFCVDVSP